MATTEVNMETAGQTRARRLERIAFLALVVAQLLPVWLFRCVPTQDGPAHLANAVILRDYGTPGTRHHEFFELAFAPFPNWTAHLLLWGLSWIMHPLSAEKVLVTGYMIGFAYSCRYFLAAWPSGCIQLAPLCLLFVSNRCLYMGFYSYCLSLPLVFVILGVCARLPERLSPAPLLTLAALFLLAYFTHLVGYLQAVLGALVLVLGRPGGRWMRMLCVGAAMLPSSAFCADYFLTTGLTPSVIADAFTRPLWRSQPAAADRVLSWKDLTHLNRDVFITFQSWNFPVALCCWLIYGAHAIVSFYDWCRKPDRGSLWKNWLPVLAVSAVMSLLYVVAPEAVGDHGGYLKPRLAIVLPALWLALLRPPSMLWIRYTLLTGTCLLVAVQIACTCSHFAAANRLLSQYLAGMDQLGHGHVIYVVQTTNVDPWEVSYLLHASNYYSLDTACTNLDNYEAGAHYFPVRFRPGLRRGRGGRSDFAFYPRHAAVDRTLAWEWPPRVAVSEPNGFREIMRSGSLTIYGRERP